MRVNDLRKFELLLILINLLFLFNIVNGEDFAQLTTSPGYFTYTNLALVGLALALVFIVLSYYAGQFFNYPQLIAFSKEELNNLIFTIVLIVFLMGAISAFREFSYYLLQDLSNKTHIAKAECLGNIYTSNLIKRQGNNIIIQRIPFEAAFFAHLDWFLGCIPILEQEGQITLQQIDKQIIDKSTAASDLVYKLISKGVDKIESNGILLTYLYSMYIDIITFEMVIGPVSTLGFSVYVPESILLGVDLSLAPLSGLNLISESLILLSNIVGFSMINIIVQKVLLKFIYINILSLLLPVGIAFRCIPFLRKTGNAIIALSIAAYFVYPLSLWINEQIYFNSFFDKSGKFILTQWQSYNPSFGDCLPKKEGETYEEYRKRVEKMLQESKMEDVQKEKEELEKQVYTADPRLFSQTKLLTNIGDTFISNSFETIKYLFGVPKSSQSSSSSSGILDYVKFIFQMFLNIFTTPFRTEQFFKIIYDKYIVAGQWIVINLMFLINSIVLTITFYKNISKILGGEEKIFGIGRLL